MSRISRFTQAIFGSGGLVGSAGFGAAAASNTSTGLASSTSLSTLQSLGAWVTGWLTATIGGSKFPALEDMNAFNYVITSQLAYLLQQGIAEWDAGTTYYNNSLVISPGTTLLYKSITNANLNNALSDPTNWQPCGDISLVFSAKGQALFQYTSATQCKVIPKNGNQVSFPDGSVATIPSAGITTTYNSASVNGTAAQTLAASSLLYAYLWINSGTPTIDWSATAYAVDSATGIVIKSGAPTRVLVGMAFTNSSSQFVNSTSSVQVRSWFNDNGIGTTAAFTTNRSTSSGTLGEINTEIRNNVLTWAGERVQASIVGTSQNGAANTGTLTALGVDSTTASSGGTSINSSVGAGQNFPAAANFLSNALSEGLHFLTLLGSVQNSNTSSWSTGCTLTVATNR